MAREATEQVRVTPGTWKRLNQLKGPGDSFEDIISGLLDEHEDVDDTRARARP